MALTEDERRQRHRDGQKRYRATHREACLKRKLRWEKANPARVREIQKRYVATHLKAVRERRNRWRREHPERGREYQKGYRLAHLDYRRSIDRNYKARKHNAQGSHDADDIALIRQQQQSRCWWCGEKIKGAGHIDHRIPLSRNGSNDPENLVLSCATCNTAKKAKTPAEFALRLF